MIENILYKQVIKKLKKNLDLNKNLNILEIGCGNQIYKKFLFDHNYEGLDLPFEDNDSPKWRLDSKKPDIEIKLENFEAKKNYDLIFSVGTIFMLDEKDLKALIKLILTLKFKNGKAIFFDYNKNTIDRLIKTQNDGFNYNQNNYCEILKKTFKENFRLLNTEWCSNNIFKKNIKEFLKINKGHVIEIDFNKN